MLTHDSIEVGVFTEAFVKFIYLSFFQIRSLIPGIGRRVRVRGGQSLDNFDVVIHIEAPFGDIVHIFLSFGSISKLPLGNLFDGVEILLHGLVLGFVPGDVAVGIVGIHSMRGKDCFGVIHDKIITK